MLEYSYVERGLFQTVLTWQPVCVCVALLRPSQLAGTRKATTDFASFTRSATCISFQAIIHVTIFTATIFGVWSMFGSK